MQTLRGKLFLSGMDENAAALARKWGLGLELTDFCEARKLEEPAAMEAARARCSGIGSLWLHAPFAELSPCAIDPRVREVVMLRFRQTVQAALALGIVRNLKAGFAPELIAGKREVIGSGNAVRLLKSIQWAIRHEFGLPLRLPDTREEAATGAALLAQN